MHLIVTLILLLVGLPALGACLYLLALTLLSADLPTPAPSARRMRFDVIVPAHNEVAVLPRLMATLERLDWPRDRYRVLVIADNCTDETAALARSLGATVLERHEPQRRGKGYALQFAFEARRAQRFADAVVVVDADAEVSENLLEAISARLERGAEAVQVQGTVSNAADSWRTRLLTIATAAFHIVRSRARERLGLSCGIRGTGWAVTNRVLEAVPYHSYSLAEDLEYGIELGLAGYPVHCADEASSHAEMVTGERDARSQRRRWELGRLQLIRSRTLPLLAAAVRRRDPVCLDLAFDLMVLPLSYVALQVGLFTLLAVLAGAWSAAYRPWEWTALLCWVGLVSHVLRGWQLSGVGPRGLLDLARVPVFLAWKLIVMLGRRDSSGWIRTRREGS